MSGKTWGIFAAILIVVFGGIIFLNRQSDIDVSGIDQNKVQPASELSGNIADRTFGSEDNKVILMEYGDFQCPGCASAAGPLKTIKEKYSNQLTFVFRNFPITSIHPNALAAAAAAETAGEMGKYWQMHDLLYGNQDSWNSASTSERTNTFGDFASQIGLNRDEFVTKLSENSESIREKIRFDQAVAKKAGVTGTPTIYLNGELVDQYVKDGKIVPQGTEGAQSIWADAEAFDTLLVQPALEKAGYDLSDVE